MAEGPMSTPRRSWPRSIGTPKIPAGRRAPSDKRHAPGGSWIGGGLEEALWGTPDGVDPAEVHVGSLERENLLVPIQISRTGTGFVGEEISLGMKARGEDRGLQRHPDVEHVHQGLQDGGGDPGRPGRAQSYEAAFFRGDDGRAHAGDQTFPRLQRVEALGIQFRLAQSVVHRDAGAGDDEPRAVTHRGGDGDGKALGVDAGDVRGLRRAEDAPTLLSGVLLARQAPGHDLVLRAVHVRDLPVVEGEPHRAGHHPRVVGVGHGGQIVTRDDPEHLGERRSARRGRTVSVDGPRPVSAREGFAYYGLVLRQIPLGYDAAHLQDVGGEAPGQLALVEEVSSFIPYRLQRVRELGEAHLLALQVDPIPVEEVLVGLLGKLENLLGDLEPHGARLAQPETLPGEPYRRREGLPEREPPVPFQQRLPTSQRPRHRYRSPSHGRVDPRPVLEDDGLRAATRSEGGGRQALARHRVVVVYEL